jgi:hypothetical protein
MILETPVTPEGSPALVAFEHGIVRWGILVLL